ncbi:MAG: hypothetical protein ACYTFM_12850 [Planctomycetota bacterium]|jgi:hypothetical protein
MKNSIDEIQRPNSLRQYIKWWPALLGPLTMVLVYTARFLDIQWIVSRGPNENIALVLVGISLVGFTVQAILFRSEFHLFMAVLCGAFFCREWHFPGTSKGIYIALGILAFWAVMRRKKLETYIKKNSMVKIWIPCTFATYFLSQLIARRAIRGILPIEDQMKIALEESVETMAHIMMIAVCLIALKIRQNR